MNDQISQSVLLLEDDDTYRSFVAGLLQSRGMNVIEASSAREATTKLGTSGPALAIVDYRLPESDGITWITRMREQGKNFPVVFLSAIWCDEKTFDWLRNILRVSLILQKPLIPDLFLQQIESLLPRKSVKEVSELDLEKRLSDDTPHLSGKSAKMEQVHTKTGMVVDKKLDMKERMAILRKDYAGELSKIWQDLTEAINLVKEDPTNAIEKNQAKHIAHKIKGTAGSIGFTQVGELAGKLEDLLQGLDPEDSLCQVVWSEILRALPVGKDMVQAIIEKTKAENNPVAQSRPVPVHNLLFVGDKVNYSQYLPNLSKKFSVEIDLIDSVLTARAKLGNQTLSYDAAILDMDCVGSKQNLLDLTREIRLTQGHKSIPLSLVLPLQNPLSAEELAYAGMSSAINKDSLEPDIETAIATMFSAIQQQKPRVLVVDDDEVLSRFLVDLLSDAGMIVQTLHKPIKIVSTAELFNPDLILLDVVMPGLSGYDVCRILRATEKWRQLPVLFLTSTNDQTSRTSAFQAGGSDFLCKPVIREEVLVRVKTHLQNSLAKKQLQRDELTDVLTNKAFVTAASDLLVKAGKDEQSFIICLINMEDFAKFSVQHGWYPMQTVLSTLGKLLRTRFKADDLRGRLAEGTFALAFCGESRNIVERIMADLRNEFGNIKFSSDSVGHFKTIFNVGIAEYPSDGSTVGALLEVSSKSLMHGKLSSII
jgi:diguanylate cyclase (GGDEF)-like protein